MGRMRVRFVEYKHPVAGQLSEPARELCVAVEMDLLMGLGQIVSIALLLKSCAASH